ncbi:hypothetical protein [Desertivirga brevis]|uniref:hypothetical protein n=1 Tax=Desertivirga brevis TaxID=2810310 RepID=UPI001A95978E|nr:hypothetical protein [Pedobacter sp. SYSU D00873]
MKKNIFITCILLGITCHCLAQESKKFLSFDKYLIKNYVLPDSVKSDCNFNYLAMTLQTSAKGEITGIRYLNDATTTFKKSFDYLKGFNFGVNDRVNGRSLLLIAVVDQKNRTLCPSLYQWENSPSNVTESIVGVIQDELSKNSQTILLGSFKVVAPGPPIR